MYASKVCRYLRGLHNGQFTLYTQPTLVICLREAAASPYPPGASYCRSELAARLMTVFVLLRRRQLSMCCVCSRVCKAAMAAAEADLAEVEDELADLYMLFSTGHCAQVEWCFRHAERVLHVLTCPLPHMQKPIPATKLRRRVLPNSANRLVCMHKASLSRGECSPAETYESISCWLQGLEPSAEGWCYKTYAYDASAGSILDLRRNPGTSHCIVICQCRCSHFITIMTGHSCQHVIFANM